MNGVRKSRPTRLGELLSGYLKSAGLAERLEQASVVDAWARLVGERIAEVAVPESVGADGTLFVRVRSSAWRQELSLMTPEVLALVNASRTSGRIKRIRWLLGGESADAPARGRARGRGRP
jgi:predicted nucleic acid-binding Zn ribbon protein